MKNTNIPPFYVGQRVVAIKSYGDNYNSITKGHEYIILGVLFLSCCNVWAVDIGKVQNYGAIQHSCGHVYKIDNIHWIIAALFAPIETTFESISFKKVVEIESPLIGIN